MQYLRKVNNVNPHAGTYLSINIPKDLTNIFKTGMAVIEPLKDGGGISIRPAKIEAV